MASDPACHCRALFESFTVTRRVLWRLVPPGWLPEHLCPLQLACVLLAFSLILITTANDGST